jgi:hypothetical protein
LFPRWKMFRFSYLLASTQPCIIASLGNLSNLQFLALKYCLLILVCRLDNFEDVLFYRETRVFLSLQDFDFIDKGQSDRNLVNWENSQLEEIHWKYLKLKVKHMYGHGVSNSKSMK